MSSQLKSGGPNGTRLMIDGMKIFAIRLENGDTAIVSGDTSEGALRNAGIT
jgi:hypothetical protein